MSADEDVVAANEAVKQAHVDSAAAHQAASDEQHVAAEAESQAAEDLK